MAGEVKQETGVGVVGALQESRATGNDGKMEMKGSYAVTGGRERKLAALVYCTHKRIVCTHE